MIPSRTSSPLILDVALGRRASIRIYGNDYPTPDGTCIRDYIHVADLAEAHLLAFEALDRAKSEAAAESESDGRLIYNLGNGRGFSVLEVIESARRITGQAIPAEQHPAPPRRSGNPRRQLPESHPRAWLEAEILRTRCNPPHSMGLAPEALRLIHST